MADRLTKKDVKKAKASVKDFQTKNPEQLRAANLIDESPTDPYMRRNEFKPGFYDQVSKPATTAETMYGKGNISYDVVDPDTSMMMNAMAEGGSVRGQKAIQVKKKIFKGVF